jgi:hypothetical protein
VTADADRPADVRPSDEIIAGFSDAERRAASLIAERLTFVFRLGAEAAREVAEGTVAELSATGLAIVPAGEGVPTIARDVVQDYAEQCCDHLATCVCSMARLARAVAEG